MKGSSSSRTIYGVKTHFKRQDSTRDDLKKKKNRIFKKGTYLLENDLRDQDLGCVAVVTLKLLSVAVCVAVCVAVVPLKLRQFGSCILGSYPTSTPYYQYYPKLADGTDHGVKSGGRKIRMPERFS